MKNETSIKTSEHINPGQVYTRKQLQELFDITDATINTGIFQPPGHRSIWLFVTENKTLDRPQYFDKLEGDLLDWDSQPSGRKDHLIVEHRERDLELLLFYRKKKYEYPGAGFRYEGQLEYESHKGKGPAHFRLRLLPTINELELVTSRYEIGWNIIAFNQMAVTARDRIRKLLSSTTYWVACIEDPDRGEILIGPSKFVGFKEMTFKRYEMAATGNCTGVAFDGALTRRGIEAVTGETFQPSNQLSELLQKTGRAMAAQDDIFQGVDTSKWRFISLDSDRRYWAFLCVPEKYRIQEAAAVLDVDTWSLPTGDPRPGDRLVFWKAKGREEHRGVVALGEVVSEPELIPLQPGSERFWVESPDPAPARRVRIRYVVPPGAPFWLEDDESGLLASLTVSRAQGSKPYNVTSEQWTQLLDVLGGWPDEQEQLLDEAVADAAQQTEERRLARGRGQGFISSPERKKAIEDRAMIAAKEFFEARDYRVTNTAANRPYDYLCQKGEDMLYVEVKGTTGDGEHVHLTKNEVRHARHHRQQMALFILHGIEVTDGEDGPVASGGAMILLWPWDVDVGQLVPISYTYHLPD